MKLAGQPRMELLYKSTNLVIPFEKGEYRAVQRVLDELGTVDPSKEYEVSIRPVKQGRSVEANSLLWKCIGMIATALKADKWDIYLKMLKRYGKFTYIAVREEAVEAVKKQWRECEVVGEVTVNGQKAVQMLCYYGSSTYNTQEFSHLLDGIMSEMDEMGLKLPPREDVQEALERYEKEWQKNH